MSELPSGWAESALGEIGDYLNGRGFKKSEWREAGRPIIRIQNLTGTTNHFNYFDGEPEEHYTARPGDLLVSWAATIGVFVWNGPEAVVNQHIFKVRSHIDRDFHRYLLLSVLNDLRRQTHGSGMVHITKGRFEATPVAVPPLAEQRRVVAAIEEHFSRLDSAERSLHVVRRKLGTLRHAALLHAVDGRLPVRPLQEVLVSLRNGIFVSRPAAVPPGIPIFRISAVRPLALDVHDVRFADIDPATANGFFVQEGDLLFTRYSGNPDYVGACACVPALPRPTLHPDKLILAVVDRSAAEPGFIAIALSTGPGRRAIEERRKTSAGQVGIAGSELKKVPVPVPPLDEQRRIVAEAERQLSIVDAMLSVIAGALSRSAALRRSILEQAFTGKLVPQDPSDEPVSMLLERIAAERAAAPKAARRTRKIPG